MNAGSVLEVQGVTVRFGGLTALDAVSLDVPPRHVLGVIGPNGAGKTTLLNVLCGFIRPDAGEVLFGGRRPDIRPHRLASLGVARTLQGVGLYGGLTAVENVMVGATCRASAGFWSALLSLPRASRDEHRLREEAMAALDRVGAAEVAQAGIFGRCYFAAAILDAGCMVFETTLYPSTTSTAALPSRADGS